VIIKRFADRSFRAQGYILVLLSTVAFASYGVWAKLLGDTYGVFTQAWTRALIVSIILLVAGLLTKQLKPIAKKDIKWVAVYTGFSLLTVAPIYYAFIKLGIGTATILFYAAYMVASYLIGRLFFKEKITVAKVVAMLMAILGMIMVFGIELAGASALALILAVINGIASGGEVSFTKKVSDKYSVIQLTLITWVVVFVSHFIAAVVVGESLFPRQSLQSSTGILLYGVVAMVALWLVVAAYRKIEPGIGGLIGTLEVPFAVLFGVVFFGEHLALQAIIGGLLIFVAAAIPDGVELIKKRLLNR